MALSQFGYCDMSVRWKECVFPALTVLWVTAYWIQLEGAPRAARVVPDGVMAFILLLIVIIIMRDAVIWTDRGTRQSDSADVDTEMPTASIKIYQEMAFVGLSVIYYIIFDFVGFHPANVAFLAIALRITGNPWRTVLVGTVATSLITFGVTEMMQFNLPAPKLFR